MRKLKIRSIQSYPGTLSCNRINGKEVYEEVREGEKKIELLHLIVYPRFLDNRAYIFYDLPMHSSMVRNQFSMKSFSLDDCEKANKYIEGLARNLASERVPLSEIVD